LQSQQVIKMKKLVLIAATIGVTVPGIAQDKYVVSANIAMKNQNFEEAKTEIDKAMASPETREKPKALFAKAQIYYMLQDVDKYKATNPYREGLQAVVKLAEVKADYEKATVDNMLLRGAFLSYNDGVKAYNDKRYTESVELMKTVVKVHDMGAGGKRFEKLTGNYRFQFDTVAADADLTMANSAYYAGNMDEAIPMLIKVKSNPIRKMPSVYECLIDAYSKQKNAAQELATIQEGRKEFPNDVTLRNYELNYYIKAGKMDELIKRLEDAAAKEPNNSDILFNIATTYLSMASPKDGKKPANAAELYTKSEDAFMRALKISPDNSGYNYNFGALYFNQATDFNDQINAITGSSAADQKKYDELKAKRDALFGKASPYFEKSFAVLSPNESTMKGEDLKTYKSTLMALNKIYIIQSKLDKAADMKKRMELLN
jgi:predicted Zn-dependent protease